MKKFTYRCRCGHETVLGQPLGSFDSPVICFACKSGLTGQMLVDDDPQRPDPAEEREGLKDVGAKGVPNPEAIDADPEMEAAERRVGAEGPSLPGEGAAPEQRPADLGLAINDGLRELGESMRYCADVIARAMVLPYRSDPGLTATVPEEGVSDD